MEIKIQHLNADSQFIPAKSAATPAESTPASSTVSANVIVESVKWLATPINGQESAPFNN